MEKDTQRPIYIGDGIVPQVERFAGKYVYNRLSIQVFNTAMGEMVQKATQPTGNKFVFICNERMWYQIQEVLSEYLSRWRVNNTYMYSKAKNGYIDVGATYQSYEWAGNQVTFMVDRTFTYEYGTDKGYGLFLDCTADLVKGEPAMQLFTLKGGDFISNKFPGVGGLDGLSSGVVSSNVAANKLINWGYSAAAVFAPYRSFILQEG